MRTAISGQAVRPAIIVSTDPIIRPLRPPWALLPTTTSSAPCEAETSSGPGSPSGQLDLDAHAGRVLAGACRCPGEATPRPLSPHLVRIAGPADVPQVSRARVARHRDEAQERPSPLGFPGRPADGGFGAIRTVNAGHHRLSCPLLHHDLLESVGAGGPASGAGQGVADLGL